ncbi:MAG: peptide chain release factor N(5)-glutamine methyltransferase [Methylophilus sp.]|nr:peptide chain release factor N(5)-glutamine methyltransferase [Methylophilus sp.]
MPKNHSIKMLLRTGTAQLQQVLANPESAFFETNLLLQQVLNVNRAWLITHEEDTLAPNQQLAFEALLQRRIDGEPMAYILGEREFYGMHLKVTPSTLIPRPDTEILVEIALNIIQQNVYKHILDLGTGTGAIALAIAKQCPNVLVTAVEASEDALKVAQENAFNLKISNVQFVLSDWFDALQGNSFDVIVSNPPYIEANDAHLSQGDVRFEPRSALVSGEDGLDDIRHIITHAPQYLNPLGWLIFEHGYNQAKAVAALLHNAGFSHVETVMDLGGNDRVTFGRLSILMPKN